MAAGLLKALSAGKGIPIDSSIHDWRYWDPQQWGSHLFGPNRYPDPATTMRQGNFPSLLKKRTFHVSSGSLRTSAPGLNPRKQWTPWRLTTGRPRPFPPGIEAKNDFKIPERWHPSNRGRTARGAAESNSLPVVILSRFAGAKIEC
jgi:hypothetical protein